MGKWRHGVVLDAGSSGTRVFIYRWLNHANAREEASQLQLSNLPVIEVKGSKKIHPGISTFGDHPHDVGPEHLDLLLSYALERIPPQDVPHTPFFLLATAGMRILPERQQKDVLAQVCAFVRRTTHFQMPDCHLHVQIIPGETEGLYGWIAANYLMGSFDQSNGYGREQGTYGFLDMGGASAQMAFAPNATEAEKHANDLTLVRLRAVDGTTLEYKVFVTTWLGFGVNQARQRYVKALLDSSSESELPDPCLPAHLKVHVTKDGTYIEPHTTDEEDQEQEPAAELFGTGNFQECLHKTHPLLEKEHKCLDAPCLMSGQHAPAIDFHVNHFIGISEYWHTTHEIFQKGQKTKTYDLNTYQQRVHDFCSQAWETIEEAVEQSKWGAKVDQDKARQVCFKASWIINMLHDGIGVPRVGIEELKSGQNGSEALLDGAKSKGYIDSFTAVDKIDKKEVSWTLGKMVLYASSEVQLASDDALAVGFGPNVPGLPSHFHQPGGVARPYESDSNWRRLFVENPRRIPAFFIMMFIMVFIFCVAIGKERRAYVRKILARLLPKKQGKHHQHRRRGRGFPAKLFGLGGHGQQAYERVDVEDGEGGNDYELEETCLDSSEHDSSEESEERHYGGPRGKAKSRPKSETTSIRGGLLSQASTLGLGPHHAFDRTGLLSRTESRERIRSRANSPKRVKGDLSRLNE